MWDKKGENLTYRFLRLLKEQTEDKEAQNQQELADIALNATKKAPRCLKSNILAFGAVLDRDWETI